MIDYIIYAGILLGFYMVFCAVVPMILKSVFKIPDELVRKSQHIAYALSIFLIIQLFDVWYVAIISSGILIGFAYPFLKIVEKTKLYKKILIDRKEKGGELRESLLLIQISFGLLILIFWGLLGEGYKYIIPVAVITWGFGDAAAALFGKAFGKTKIKVIFVDHKKTWFGSHAMTITSGITLCLMLIFYAHQLWYVSIIISIAVAPFSSALELFSKKGFDTLWVPLGTALGVFLWMLFMMEIGWAR